ncbi:MAG: hypothetical protein L0332_17815 [Chloroflexi bacterium]|nr:hypothetical protein [Chloroflexota bacterium]
MDAVATTPSPALEEANRRLYELRAKVQAERPVASEPLPTTRGRWQTSGGRPLQGDGQPLATVEKLGGLVETAPTTVERVAVLPDHLGWDSEAATRAIRTALTRRATTRPAENLPRNPLAENNDLAGEQPGINSKVPESEVVPCGSQVSRREVVKHHPSLGLAALNAGEAPVYQVWLACRFLDEAGRGWLDIQDVREQLTSEVSPLRLCGWRRLRQILGQGNGCYWIWDKERSRLWLFGVARLAVYLGVERLAGRPVELPVSVLSGDIGAFKAHLYGAWHSGRKQANPITRARQRELTGLPERTQRRYCRIAGVRRQQNIAILGRYTTEEVQESAWRHGRAVFEFYDYKGRQGQPGGRYLARYMPATHIGPHNQATRGRQRKINRKLKDLVNKGARGNGGDRVNRLYFHNGAAAAKAYNRRSIEDAYWPQTRSPVGSYRLWGVLLAR